MSPEDLKKLIQEILIEEEITEIDFIRDLVFLSSIYGQFGKFIDPAEDKITAWIAKTFDEPHDVLRLLGYICSTVKKIDTAIGERTKEEKNGSQ